MRFIGAGAIVRTDNIVLAVYHCGNALAVTVINQRFENELVLVQGDPPSPTAL